MRRRRLRRIRTRPAGEAITIENCGRTVEIPTTPTAVVGPPCSQTELLLRLGLADSLVGQAQATAQKLPADVAGMAADVPVIGGDAPPSREELLAVEPDFVYSPTTYEFTAEQGFASIEQLADAGVAAYTATGGCFDRRMRAPSTTSSSTSTTSGRRSSTSRRRRTT